jgi:hypothetical protein
LLRLFEVAFKEDRPRFAAAVTVENRRLGVSIATKSSLARMEKAAVTVEL